MPTTYFLNADTGNDSTVTNTSGTPWLTIAKALTVAIAGDTVTLQTSTAHYTWANATIPGITIQGVTLAGAVIDAGAAPKVWTLSNATISFINLRFTNNKLTSATAPFTNSSGAPAFSFTNCQFDNIQVWDADAGAMLRSTTGCTLTLTGCLVYNITSNGTAAGTIWRGNGTITLTMTTCTTYVNGTGTSRLVNFMDGNVSGTCTNCIFQNAGDAMTNFRGHAGLTLTMNQSCINGSGATGYTVGAGVVTSDPLLVDPVNACFNLRPTSPCVDVGAII